MSYAHPIDRYSFLARRASPTETELSRAADSFGLLNGIPYTLRVREIGGVLFLQSVIDGDVFAVRSLGVGKEAARVNLAIELWDLVSLLDLDLDIDPDPVPFTPSFVSRASGWFSRVAVAVAPLATATAFLVAALH